ncbi:hypothetical protein OAK36_03700, partial [Akkermansiaceae bacterium]|nr:hypothetical protein [Akkermansiaceae bacterium]
MGLVIFFLIILCLGALIAWIASKASGSSRGGGGNGCSSGGCSSCSSGDSGGYSVICCVKNEDLQLQVLFDANSNGMVESLKKGDLLSEELKFVSYDSLFQRPIMGQVISSSCLENKIRKNDEEIKMPY